MCASLLWPAVYCPLQFWCACVQRELPDVDIQASFERDVQAALAFAETAAVTTAVAKRRAHLLHEFEDYLVSTRTSATMLTCTASHVLGFLHAHYRHQHSGSRVSGMVSPSTLTNVAETLGTLFVQAGRNRNDIPARDKSVRQYLKSYYVECRDKGFALLSAKPISQQKLTCVLDALERKVLEVLEPFRHVLLLRDMAMFAYLWATQCRVRDMSTLRVDKVFIYQGGPRPAFQDVMNHPLSAAASLLLVPVTDKTHHYARPPSRLLDVADPAAANAIQLLYRYFMARAWARIPFEGPLFPAAASSAHTFQDAPLSSAAVNAVIRLRFSSVGQFAAETSYSFKRGSIQADADAGKSALEISMKSGVLTPKQLEKYLDRGRHVPR